MRIAMLIPSLGGGGAERIVLELADGMRRAGHETDILLLDQSRLYAVPNGLSVQSLQYWKESVPTLLKGISLPVAYWRLHKVLRKNNYDVVVSHMERCNGLLLSRPGNIPSLLVAHNFLGTSLPAKKIIKYIYGMLIYNVAAWQKLPIAFVAEAARHDALKLFSLQRKNTTVLPNFINVQDIATRSCRPLTEEWEKIMAGPVVIAAGRLAWQKGHWHLIRAFGRVVAEVPEAKLLILGEGELRQRLEGLVLSLGLNENIFLPGFVGDVFPLMRCATAFVLSSLNEGMPMILLEALACGCAIVSTDCPSGPREILAPDTSFDDHAQAVEVHASGLLTPRLSGQWYGASVPLTRQEEKLAEALLMVISNKDMNDGLRSAAKERAANFSCEAGIARWVAVLERLAGGRSVDV